MRTDDGATTTPIDYYQREYAWPEDDVRVLVEVRPGFAAWLLSHVVMAGIRTPSQDNAYRIFETGHTQHQ
ncbi:MAG TPA: hypothetical protein VE733_03435 [Streptosporangiaceae bacterium]|nr:hypothetical protein [Streptosporangiaceae bacterium]